MNSVGKASSSFVVLDLMRLPHGILTGVGFIGGGGVLKRSDSIHGVTTLDPVVRDGGRALFWRRPDWLGRVGPFLGLLTLGVLKLLEVKLLAQRRVQSYG